ncbi:MAG: sodium/proline symporter [Coxiella sp. RIFCSPHIGHO2_12_FULL_42_15]|nr:MAG: sodium/proline symporter [Coxiella sp. RIFCSPHIGHO2_12_FULL_42_15]
MTQTFSYLFTFVIYFLLIAILCFIANKRNDKLSNYMLGGRHLSGPVTALGAGASDMSGWLLLALPGTIFVNGLNQIWMPIGLFVGAYLNWIFISPRLRTYTEIANNALTIPAYLDHRFRDNSTLLRAFTAIVVLIFFTFYSAAGFVSGALLFKVAFHLDYHTALWVGAIIVMLYTAVGGFLAINWIDFFQGTLMFFALLITPIVTYSHLDDTMNLFHTLAQNTAGYFNPTANITLIGIFSLLGWGLGYFGQPHILMRFMAVRSVKELPIARQICMTWMGLSLLGAILTGLFGHAYFLQGVTNPEEVFLKLSRELFAPILTGVLLSAVLSAMMSTVSAQLLAASSALTADFYARFFRRQASQKELVIVGRCGVIFIAFVAIYLASNPTGSILELVSYAWGGLGAAFGPIILLSLFWKRTTHKAAIVGIFTGTLTVIVWKLFMFPLGGWFAIYEIIPGFVLASAAIIGTSLMDKIPSQNMYQEFEEAKTAADV